MWKFYKYEGAGNDFILIEDTSFSGDVVRLCDRKRGIGADGVILIQPSTRADVRMRIFNSDGVEAESCGNGLRCLVHHCGKPRLTIEIGHRVVTGVWDAEGIAVDMGAPSEMRLNLHTECGLVHYVDSGVPHAVVLSQELALDTIAPILRHHPLFAPRGANVTLAHLGSTITAHTFERGVEGETLACGTGAVAIAAALHALGHGQERLSIAFPGGTLTIRKEGTHFWMGGPVHPVFSGKMLA